MREKLTCFGKGSGLGAHCMSVRSVKNETRNESGKKREEGIRKRR